MDNKKKILILALVFLSIGGVFFAKKASEKKEENTAKVTETVKNEEKKTEVKEENKENDKKDTSNGQTATAIEPLKADENINFQELVAKGKPIILEFSQEHWHACKLLHPTLEKLHEKYGDKVIIKSVDIAKIRDFVKDYPVRVTPTLFYFKPDGKAFEPTEELTKELNYVSYKRKTDGDVAFAGSEGVVEYEAMEKLIEEMISSAR